MRAVCTTFPPGADVYAASMLKSRRSSQPSLGVPRYPLEVRTNAGEPISALDTGLPASRASNASPLELPLSSSPSFPRLGSKSA